MGLRKKKQHTSALGLPLQATRPKMRIKSHRYPTRDVLGLQERCYTLKELQGLFRQQLGVEMATTVTVESVEKAPLLTEEVLQAVRGWGCFCLLSWVSAGQGSSQHLSHQVLSLSQDLYHRAGPGCLGTVVTPCATPPCPPHSPAEDPGGLARRMGVGAVPGAAGDQGE